MKGARLKRLRTMCFPLCDILEKTKLRGENACQWMLVTEMEGAWLESGKRKVGRGNVRHLDCGGDFMTVFVVKIHKRGILPYGNFISLKKKKRKKPLQSSCIGFARSVPSPKICLDFIKLCTELTRYLFQIPDQSPPYQRGLP